MAGLLSESLPIATRQLFNHPGGLSLAMDQMGTIKLFAGKKKSKYKWTQPVQEIQTHVVQGPNVLDYVILYHSLILHYAMPSYVVLCYSIVHSSLMLYIA